MVDTQHFCLRWNNYQSSITSAFENLRDDEDFVDVTLACDGRSLKAHRVVLSACSPYFRELLKVSNRDDEIGKFHEVEEASVMFSSAHWNSFVASRELQIKRFDKTTFHIAFGWK